MSNVAASNQRARKEGDKRALQKATIAIGVVSLGLTGALVYAAASDAVSGNTSAPPSGLDQSVNADLTLTPEIDDDHGPKPPVTSVGSPQPGTKPVAVTGGS